MIFLILSAILLSISTPISIALDNIAIGIGLLGLILIYKKLKLSDLDYGILGVQAIGVVSALFSIDFLYSIKKSRFLWHFIPYFITSRVERDKIPIFINILGFFGIVASLGVIFQAFTGISPLHLTSNIHLLPHPIRADGFFHNPFTTVGVLSVILFTFFGLFLFYGDTKLKIYYFIIFVTVFLGIIFTMCRSYWIGVTIGICMLPLIHRDSKIAKIIPPLLISLFLIIYLFVPIVHKRIQTIVHYNKDTSSEIRLMLWKSGLELYRDYSIKNKLIGCGNNHLYHFSKPYIIKNAKLKFGSIKNSYLHYEMHNLYLQILLQWGIVGLLFWLMLWIYILWKNLRFIPKTNDNFHKALIIGFTMGFISFLVGGFFEYNIIGDSEISMFLMYILGINKNVLDSLK